MATTTFVYDDPEHPDRPTGTIASPAYTPEDQALLMGLDMYEADLCSCGHPRSVAWHTEMDGWFESEGYKCFACTARNDGKDVGYTVTKNTRPADKGPMPEFVLGKTTASPT
jgi:hypothetical protein